MESGAPSDRVRKIVREVAPEDLFTRPLVSLDAEPLRHHMQGKVALVTGAAGSIGSELCRQIARLHPQALVGFDKAEAPLARLTQELAERFPGLAFHPVAGDIARFDDVERAMRQFQPSLVYHTAASKHVPALENQLFEAVENNIFATRQVAMAAAAHAAACFVLISTDKAVNPASVMGATKRVAELLVRAIQPKAGTKFVTVRFGNVLGSSGSVLPIFKTQIAAGGPVTVTHPEMERYFMAVPEAAQLVLQASVPDTGGESFVLDMGQPIRIVDLAESLIRLSGLEPGRDIAIACSGIRPGEKLREELVFQSERLVSTQQPGLNSIVSVDGLPTERIEALFEDLQHAVAARNAIRTLALLQELVPEYRPSSQVLDSLGVKVAGPVSAPAARMSAEECSSKLEAAIC